MKSIDHVVIIYNPKSTRAAAANARRLARRLENRTEVNVHVTRTNHPGHGEELAKEYADTYENILFVSSSGDGGYHEIVNGILSSGNTTTVAAELLPSGNANDHYKWVHQGRLVRRINQVDIHLHDVIEIDAADSYTRFAHSYAGLGLSAQAAQAINQSDVTRTSEVAAVLKAFSRITPVRLRIGAEEKTYTNFICANIGKMSKYFSIEGSDSTDGQFEVIRNKTDKPSELAAQMARAMTFGLDDVEQLDELNFTCLEPTVIQMDGELHELAKHEKVTIRCRQQLLKTII